MPRIGLSFSAASFGAVIVVASLLAGPASVMAGDKLTEANMTQRDYNKITEMESSVEGQPPVEAPRPVHNLSEADEKAVKERDSVKVIPGKIWKNETPEERDAHIRRIRATMPEGSRLVLTVPKGDVWLIPGIEVEEADAGFENYNFIALLVRGELRTWSEAERAALPVSVPREKKVSQSDRHGTPQERAVAVAREP